MPLVVVGAFVAGVTAGWVGRSLTEPTREGLVRAIVTGLHARDVVRRAVAQYAESIEDMIAEGRMRYGLMQEQEGRVGEPHGAGLEQERAHDGSS